MKDVQIPGVAKQHFLAELSKQCAALYRELPWRQPEQTGNFSAYKILVSELMLQQTQVGRVIPKYQAFIERFPDISSLAGADFSDVLVLWSGLGYNRRARYLYDAALSLVDQPEPWDLELLQAQKGIGYNTAAAVVAYAYNQEVVFIETNIRTVLFNTLNTSEKLNDKQLQSVLEQLVPWHQTSSPKVIQDPQHFYWAMMDYGSELKRSGKAKNQHSHHYKKQSAFQGSRRQLRGKILKELLGGPMQRSVLLHRVDDERSEEVIADLEAENLLIVQDETLMLYNRARK